MQKRFMQMGRQPRIFRESRPNMDMVYSTGSAQFCLPIKKTLKKEVAMFLSQAITNFMDYQKMNSGKKYGQELSIVPGQV